MSGITGVRRRMTRQMIELLCLTVTGFCVATAGAAQQPSAPDPQPATIIGTALDVNGGVVPGATVVLNGPNSDDHQTAVTEDNGLFRFTGVHPGVAHHVTISASGFADWTSGTITPTAGQYFMVTGIELRLSTVQVSVAAVSLEQLAAQQLRIEETQRVLGIIPNFYVTYEPHPAPLTAKLKFHLTFKALTDPVTLMGFALNAGIYQAADYPSYRGGMAGYGQRLGATFAGGYTNVLVGDALLPSLLHQDPRYFYQGTEQTNPVCFMRSRLLLSPVGITGDARSTIPQLVETWPPAPLRTPIIRRESAVAAWWSEVR